MDWLLVEVVTPVVEMCVGNVVGNVIGVVDESGRSVSSEKDLEPTTVGTNPVSESESRLCSRSPEDPVELGDVLSELMMSRRVLLLS
jgi:hypothetical protein